MKRSIIFLGLVALSFTTINAANEFKSQDLDQELATLNVASTQESQLAFNQFTSEENNGNDLAVFDPNTVIANQYVKTIEDVIAESKLITESNEEKLQPLSLGYTLEDRIAEDNQITESTISNEVYALDFEKINRTVKCLPNNTAIKQSDLKL